MLTLIAKLQTNVFAQKILRKKVNKIINDTSVNPIKNNLVFFSANTIQYFILENSPASKILNLSSINNKSVGINNIQEAIAAWDSEHLILLTKQKYLLYNLVNSAVIERNDWTGLPNKWKGQLDAVCYWKKEIFAFFYGNEYVLYNRNENSYETLGLVQNWMGWPAIWKNYSTVINFGNGTLYFFKDDQHLRLEVESQIIKGPF